MVAETGSGKKFALGDQWIDLVDPGHDPLHVDLLCETRHYNQTFALGFASIAWDANGEPEARVLARIRMNIVAAQNLHSLLGQMITDALKPADTSKAN